MTVVQQIAALLEQHQNLKRDEATNTYSRAVTSLDIRRHIHDLEKNYLPWGSGFDNGSEIDVDHSYIGMRGQKIIIDVSFHHMEEGFYTKWTHHKVIVRPSFRGINVYVGGRDYRDIKDHIHAEFEMDLLKEWRDL